MTVAELIEDLQRYPGHVPVKVMFWWPTEDKLNGDEFPCRPIVEYVGSRVEISADQQDLQ